MTENLPIPGDLSGGKRTVFVVDGRKKVHTVWEGPDEVEMAEEYDLSSDELLVRKFKTKNKFGGEGEWIFEIGEPPIKHHFDEELRESSNNPYLLRSDKVEAFVFRIRNLSYPLDVYSVNVEDNKIVVRTSNKKYFKRFIIPDMIRLKLPLEQKALSFTHTGNTLIISYQKPQVLLTTERVWREERRRTQGQRPPQNGDVQCPTS
ncbi:putative DPCD protein like [Blattamonas nauphoetae]|uniref:Protein DPCD n=1 Tax=Blattamonas nauphoetae TaxID=2049346 RepID=A0ABQ9YMH7_9EUKA|nr:putative DPCD protein like [Blattamonas nauphoetae]